MRENIPYPCWFTCFYYCYISINFLVLANSLCHDQEKLALLQFKDNFLIDCSASNPSFARPKMDSWWDHSLSNENTSHCCSWDGVTCNETTGHVIGLDLSSSCLFGSFPSNTTLFGLHHLRELDLSDNNFNYSLIPSAVVQLSKLTKLNLFYSGFTGAIPSEVSTLSSLLILDLSSNSGLELQNDLSFEKFVGNLTHLTLLHLDYVDISSTVPVTLTNFTSLRSLSLVNCNLYGDFPTGILLLPTLEVLDLEFNINLEGFLPEFPFNSHLTYLDISVTYFHGKITTSIGRLGRLSVLVLWSSGFSGLIPSSIGNLTKLTTLNLGLNAFQGSLPLSLTNLTQLTSLYLSNLDVTPEILNSWLLKLSKLHTLALSRGILYDEIPQSIANHTRLSWLDLRENELTCPLPIWLANLTQLVYLDLSRNQFQGPIIPQWISKLSNLQFLSLSSGGSVAMFHTFLKLTQLQSLILMNVNIIFPLNISTNSSPPDIEWLRLESCNLNKFPAFLRYQKNLQILQLQRNNIVGTIPIWLVNKTSESLKEIDLSNNFLQGFEQPDTFLSWRNLEKFIISNNNLQGQANHLSGDLLKQICKASSLIYLDVSGNNLSGRIPTCIGTQLSASLHVLNLRDNHLHGTIPQTFTRTCNLKMIDLSLNQLEGELPKSLKNCRFLEVLDVGNNNLRGIFPSWLGDLPMLHALVLRKNSFKGEITTLDSDHAFSCLRVIDLSNNFHTGNLPSIYIQNWLAMRLTNEDDPDSSSSDIGMHVQVDKDDFFNVYDPYFYQITITIKGSETLLPKLLNVFRIIDFSSNYFTGRIPDILGSLRGLQALNLSNNHLSGEIPSSLANLIDLEAVDLSQNMLTGEIPQQFIKMTFLAMFNVSHNRLEGPIPEGQQFNTFDNSSFDGNLALCGAPLSKKCENTDIVPPPQMTDDETEEDFKLIDWIIRSLGCVSGCIVGFIIGKIFITDPHHDWFMDTFGRRQMSKTRARRSAPSRRRH